MSHPESQQRSQRTRLQLAAAAAILGLCGPVQAQLTTYTNEASWQAAVAGATRVDFDNLADGTVVSNQYPGLHFSPVKDGNPLAVAYSFTQSGLNMLSLGATPLTGAGGGVAIDFDVPRQGVGFWFLDSEIGGNVVTIYGAGGLELGNHELANPHPAEWVFVGFSAAAPNITRIQVWINDADMVALDSLQISAVPEPGSAALLLLGGLVVLRRAGWPSRKAASLPAGPAAQPRRQERL